MSFKEIISRFIIGSGFSTAGAVGWLESANYDIVMRFLSLGSGVVGLLILVLTAIKLIVQGIEHHRNKKRNPK